MAQTLLKQKITSKILSVTNLAPDVKLYRLSVPKEFTFEPGQFVMVSVFDSSKEIKRAFSIASPPSQKGSIELCVKILENGMLSSRLAQFKEGDTVLIEGPYGAFKLAHPINKELVFIAAGTGIAPLISMIEHALPSNKPMTLFFGFRDPKHFLYQHKLQAWANGHEHFNMVTTCSKDQEHPENGYVQDILPKHLTSGEGKQAYICGPPKMVFATVNALKRLGFEDIRREAWG